jgi:hypothetical protein
MTRVLVAGAGVAAVECVVALRALAGSRVAIELLAPAAELVHRPSSVTTPFGGAPAARIDLTRLAADLGIRLYRDALASVEPETHQVVARDGNASLRAARRRDGRPLTRGGPGRSDVPRPDERGPCRAGDRARHRQPRASHRVLRAGRRPLAAAPLRARAPRGRHPARARRARARHRRGDRRARAARGVRPGGERGRPRRARPRRGGARHERRGLRGIRRRTPAGERRQPRSRRRHRAA